MIFAGIYFAAKSGRMCAETIVKNSQQGARMIDEADLMEHLREWDGNWLGTLFLFCSTFLVSVWVGSGPGTHRSSVKSVLHEFFVSIIRPNIVPDSPISIQLFNH